MPKPGFFDGIGNASVSGGGIYFTCNKAAGWSEENQSYVPTSYVVEVVALKATESRKHEDLFIGEFRILDTDSDELKEGMTCSQVINITKHEAGMGNVKALLAACAGIDPTDKARVQEEITPDVGEYAVSKDQPFVGTTLGLQCVMKRTQRGGWFTLHLWSPMSDG